MQERSTEPGACSQQPALDDLELLAAVDGEAGPDVLAHLNTCPICAARAREFAELQRLLRKRLYRAFCPSSDELAAFQQMMLEGGQQAMIAAHLADCPHCSRELKLLADLFTPQTPHQ